MDLNALTEQEWEELFGEPDDHDGEAARRKAPLWGKLVVAIVAAAMVLSAVPGLVTWVRDIGAIRDPIDIVAHAEGYVASSEFGWLVSEVQIAALGEPNIAAFVMRNPADGVIILDDRPWQRGDLDETMAHEIGHLLDFAVYPGGQGNLRGGIGSEAWAECAAVSAGERRLDGEGDDDEYRCRPSELAVFEAEMAAATTICRPWGTPECRER